MEAHQHPLINRDLLKPETVKAVLQAGRLVTNVVDRWAGGWPKETLRLEKQGRLVQEAKAAVEREDPAEEMVYHQASWGNHLTHSEAMGLLDLPLHPPA